MIEQPIELKSLFDMKKQEFLAQAVVTQFVDWLVDYLPRMNIYLRLKRSAFVRQSVNSHIVGLHNVIEYYQWKSSWGNPVTHQEVLSDDWLTTKQSLAQLRLLLNSSLKNQQQQLALDACLAVLEWGGVLQKNKGAAPFLQVLAQQGNLLNYLEQTSRLLGLNKQQDLAQLNNTSIERYDAGLTKIFAILDDAGSPIYDSRVAATASYLSAQFFKLHPDFVQDRHFLNFPTSAARGEQIRQPERLGQGFLPTPYLYAQGQSAVWAQYQCKLGWIMQAVLERTSWFETELYLAARCHALEACFFMVGYDLRGLYQNPIVAPVVNSNHAQTPQAEIDLVIPTATNWVPTVHNFTNTISDYLTFRRLYQGNHYEADFIQRLMQVRNIAHNAASAYCYPLRPQEFNLWHCPIEDLEVIVLGGREALERALVTHPFELRRRQLVCLMNAFLVGQLNGLTLQEKRQQLVDAGCAGTANAAQAILSVGRNVGRHFGLLNGDQPTAYYQQFFGDMPNEI